MTETSTFIVNDENKNSAYWSKDLFSTLTTICCVHQTPIDLDTQQVFRMPCGHVICYPCMMRVRVSSCAVCRHPLELQVQQIRLPDAISTVPDSDDNVSILQFQLEASPRAGGRPGRRSDGRRRRRGRNRNRRRRRASPTPDPPQRMIDRILMRTGEVLLPEPFDWDLYSHLTNTLL